MFPSSSRAGSSPTPISSSRKSSSTGTTSSDRESLPTTGGTGVGPLDFKRLLSKPAMPVHSGGASIISLPSDVELGISSSRLSPRMMGSRAGFASSQRMTSYDSPSTSPSSPSASNRQPYHHHHHHHANANNAKAAQPTPTGAASPVGARQRNLSAPNPTSSSHSKSRDHAVAYDGVLVVGEASGIKKKRGSSSQISSRDGAGAAVATDSPQSTHTGRGREKEKERSRNVLKRKSSSKSSPSTPTVATFKAAGALSESSSSHSTSRPTSSKPTVRSSSVREITTTTSGARGSGSAGEVVVADSVYSSRSLRRKDSPPPPGLTPAETVAHAYKQQEQRREELAEISGWNDLQRQKARPEMASIRSHAHNRSSDLAYLASGGEEDPEESSGPYYTVFGSSSGRVVAAGGPQDSTWDLSYDGLFGGVAAGIAGGEEQHKKKGSGSKSGTTTPSGSVSSGVKSLTRKVSGKFKKAAGMGIGKSSRGDSPHSRSEVVFVAGETDVPYDGRPSMHQESTTSLPIRGRASMDANARDMSGEASPGYAGSGKGVRSARAYRGEDERRQKPREEEVSSSGKLWKLMKRISTGGLREKYTREASEPPPVPALPKDFRKIPTSRTTFDIAKAPEKENAGESGVLLSRFMQSRTSLSGVRPSMASHKSTASRPSTGKCSGSHSGHRPSTTTRSSSPMSSDMASSRFFHKPLSNRSSTSSYGEELPPLPVSGSPTKTIAQHILSPSELYRVNKETEGLPTTPTPTAPPRKIRKSGRSRSVPANETEIVTPVDDPRPSLPHPPRRAATLGGSKNGGSAPPSPTNPTSGNSAEAMNNFKLPARVTLSMSEFGVKPQVANVNTDVAGATTTITTVVGDGVLAPPRPKRSSRRNPPPPELTTSPSSPLGPTSPPMPATPKTPMLPSLPSLHVDFFHSRRKSVSSASIRSPSSAKGLTGMSTPMSRSPLTFREMESPRHVWTEKEKADKWDDLLERSDKAGGTLHIGGEVGGGLMSDNLRYSIISDVSES